MNEEKNIKISERNLKNLIPEGYLDKELERERVRAHLDMQKQALSFIQRVYGSLLFVTMIIIIFQGFKLWGFSLESSFLHWLGASTVGEVASLAILVYKALFGMKNE